MTFEADRGMQMEYPFDDFSDPIMGLLLEGEDVDLPLMQRSVYRCGSPAKAAAQVAGLLYPRFYPVFPSHG